MQNRRFLRLKPLEGVTGRVAALLQPRSERLAGTQEPEPLPLVEEAEDQADDV